MNNLEYAIKKLGYQGGTIHQMSSELGVSASDLLTMPQDKLGELFKVKVEPVLTMFELKEDTIKAYLIYEAEFVNIRSFIVYYGFTHEEGHAVVAEGKKLLDEIEETLDRHYDVYKREVKSALLILAGGSTKKYYKYLVTLTTKLRLDSE